MIVGFYSGRAPRVSLQVFGPRGSTEVEFVVDTAFDGDVAMPADILQRIGAAAESVEVRSLADGSIVRCNICPIGLDWDGERRSVEALVLANRPIIGTNLLQGHHLDVEAIEDGSVIIEAL